MRNASKDIEDLSRVRRMLKDGEAQRIREIADVSRSEIAAVARVSMTTVWRWEQGTRRPRGAAALRYLHALELIGRLEAK